jgi:hypothetical protein
MSDDIVTRLRLLSASQKAHRFSDLLDGWSGEAADEIERLRAEVAYLKTPCPRCDYEESDG